VDRIVKGEDGTKTVAMCRVAIFDLQLVSDITGYAKNLTFDSS
jgi:hypothetical protein